MFTITLKWIYRTQEKGSHDSRSKDNARIENVHNWSSFPQQERGRKGNVRNANVTNGEETTRGHEEGLGQEEYCEYHEDWAESRDVSFAF